MERFAVALCVLLSFAGCASTTEWARLQSIGHVGCSKNEMKISDAEISAYAGIATWTAWCEGQAYYCQNRHKGAIVDTEERGTSCTPARAKGVTESRPARKRVRGASSAAQSISSKRDPRTQGERLRVLLRTRHMRMTLGGEPSRDPEHMQLSIARPLSEAPVLHRCADIAFVSDGVVQPVAKPSYAAFADNGGHDWESLTLTIGRAEAQSLARSTATIRACDFAVRLNAQQTTTLAAFLHRWDATPRDLGVLPMPEANPPVASPEIAAPASGCQYDAQCKGERICVAGVCVDPPGKAVTAPAATK